METVRKPFQGIGNIILFNWHFYALSGGLVTLLLLFSSGRNGIASNLLLMLAIAVSIPIFISLIVSWYVYDASSLYKLDWLEDETESVGQLINIHAGFDETSVMLKEKFKQVQMTVFDFYDPEKHTEISIRRARKRYPPFPGTESITTTHIPAENNIADKIFVIFSAHEIRDSNERQYFFSELKRILKSDGELIITEHLRDIPNFIAYTVGFFHFFPKATWLMHFETAGFKLRKEIKPNPFVSTFILTHNETAN